MGTRFVRGSGYVRTISSNAAGRFYGRSLADHPIRTLARASRTVGSPRAENFGRGGAVSPLRAQVERQTPALRPDSFALAALCGQPAAAFKVFSTKLTVS